MTPLTAPPSISDVHIVSCCDGLDEALRAEVLRVWPHAVVEPKGRGWLEVGGVVLADNTPPFALAFCRQALPHVRPLRAQSINQWADAVIEGLLAAPWSADRDSPPPWRLHVFDGEGSVGGRCGLVAAAIDERLQKRWRSLRKARRTQDGPPWAEGEWLVQVVLWASDEGWWSLSGPQTRTQWGEALSPFVAGAVSKVIDKNPPSRAYAKLLEAERRLGVAIQAGETCVDLGASPGGWTYVALHRGASVVAIDRSPLRDDLMRHPKLQFIQGDAFRFAPESPVDWLLCDVIAFPQKTVAMVEDWLTAKRCKKFCVTVKFKGREDDDVLEELKQNMPLWLGDGGRWWMRHLDCNHNEVTLAGFTQTHD